MSWIINFEDNFEIEFEELNERVQDECFAHLASLARFGPELGRPNVDTLRACQQISVTT